MKKTVNLILIFFSSMLIIACGEVAKTINPDQIYDTYTDTPPGSSQLMVQTIYPETSGTNVSTAAQIVIVFTKAVNTGSVNINTNITLYNNTTASTVALTSPGTFSAGNTVLTIVPSSVLAYSNSYTVNVLAGITASDGTALTVGTTCQSTFTVLADNSTALVPTVLSTTRYPTGTVSKSQPYAEVTFSEDMSSGTITTLSFAVSGDIGGASATSVVAVNSRTYRLMLNTSTLNYGEQITVTLYSASIQSSAGVYLDTDYSWNFLIETNPDLLNTQAVTSLWLGSVTATGVTVHFLTRLPVEPSKCYALWGTTTPLTIANILGSQQESASTTKTTVHSVIINPPFSGSTVYYLNAGIDTDVT